MSNIAYPALYALFVWWFSTGAILYLDGLPQRTFRWSMIGATVLAGVASYGLVASRGDTSVTGAYMAFTSGLVVWAWLEMSYYMGFVTGPRRVACAPGCSGWRHFGHAVMSSLYHEAATIVIAAALYGVLQAAPNQVGLWTFVVLWWMQISAKLNVFLGVPNVSEEFLPDHLSFLKSFLTRKPMNLLFPVSVTVSVVLATLLVQKAFSAGTTAFETTAFSMVATLMVLAILEHWFLVLPLRANALWTWSLSSRDAPLVETSPKGNAATDGETCPHCMSQPHGGYASDLWPSPRIAVRPISPAAAAGLLAEATLRQPAQPSLARRP